MMPVKHTLCCQGQAIVEAVRQAEISEQIYYRWRKQYGGINTNDAKLLHMLEKENSRLKKIIADQALDIAILKDVNGKNFLARSSVKLTSNTLKNMKYRNGVLARH